MWLAPPGPIAVGNEELYFVTRSNTAEGVVFPLADTAVNHSWQGAVMVGRLRRHGLVSLDAPFAAGAELVTKPFVLSKVTTSDLHPCVSTHQHTVRICHMLYVIQ